MSRHGDANQSQSDRPRPDAPGPWRRERRAEGPRRVRGGVKLRESVEALRDHPRAGAWVELANRITPEARWAEAVEYATKGQVVSVHVEAGRLIADVQGRARRPYRMVASVRTWSESEWRKVIEALAGDAAIAAGLLTGELDEPALRLLESRGLPLVPDGAQVEIECGCDERGRCKHAGAAMLIFAERMIERPMEMFHLRGMPMTMLLERLRQHRAIRSRGRVAAHPEPQFAAAAEPAPPEDTALDSFWSAQGERRGEADEASGVHVSHALLRRMGPSPLKGRFPISGLLASVYDVVSERTRRLVAEIEEAQAAERDVDAAESPDARATESDAAG